MSEPTQLPDFVEPFADKIRRGEKALGVEPGSDDLVAGLAWSRWAATLTNRELAEFVLWIRNQVFIAGDHRAGRKLEEVYLRLIKRPRHTRAKTITAPLYPES